MSTLDKDWIAHQCPRQRTKESFYVIQYSRWLSFFLVSFLKLLKKFLRFASLILWDSCDSLNKIDHLAVHFKYCWVLFVVVLLYVHMTKTVIHSDFAFFFFRIVFDVTVRLWAQFTIRLVLTFNFFLSLYGTLRILILLVMHDILIICTNSLKLFSHVRVY